MQLGIGRMTRLATLVGAAAAMAIMLVFLAVVTSEAAWGVPQAPAGSPPNTAGPDGGQPGSPKQNAPSSAKPKVKLGLSINDPRAFRGYTLLNPMNKKTTYLIDMEGRVVKTWESEHNSMHAAYLLENGHLFRVAVLAGGERAFGGGPGSAGRIQEFDWDGELVWDFEFHNDKQYPHHDAVEDAQRQRADGRLGQEDRRRGDRRRAEEGAGQRLRAARLDRRGQADGQDDRRGRLGMAPLGPPGPGPRLDQGELRRRGRASRAGRHQLRRELDAARRPRRARGPDRQGRPAGPPRDAAKDAAKKAEAEKLKTIGYVGSPTQRSQRVNPDWTHVNAVDYNPELDQIVISVHEFSEIWIIDHSTTTAEAAGHTGGRSGKGGDLLYRWGNPASTAPAPRPTRRSSPSTTPTGSPAASPARGTCSSSTTAGTGRTASYSSVDELVLPVDGQGRYTLEPGEAFGPKKAVWSYSAPKKSDFYSFFISGAQRLPNGNTLICSGPNGTLFEVTPDKEMVWKYVNPVKGGFGPGGFGPGGPPRPNQVLPGVPRRTCWTCRPSRRRRSTPSRRRWTRRSTRS